MLRTALFLLAGLAVGAVTATWWHSGDEPVAAGLTDGAPVAARLAAVEERLNRETLRRADLEADLAQLRVELASVTALAPASAAALDPEDDADLRATVAAAAEVADDDVPAFARRRIRADGSDGLTDRLLDAGFSADRAQWISDRAAQLRMEALQAQYDAAREGTPFNLRGGVGQSSLRGELSDAEYERYLSAIGRPTSVRVGSVLASSPAEQAGLMPGDEVVSYSGQRIYDMSELNALILEGNPGAPVTVDVLRDGQPIQLVLPRGPIGITGGGFRRR